jgi:hypothetical protein
METSQTRWLRENSVVARTAGVLKSERLAMTIEEERAAMETAIAEEVLLRSGWPLPVTPQTPSSIR